MKPAFLRNWTLILILGIFILNALAGYLFWYDIFPWFDNMMHFLGGFWVGLATLTLFWDTIHSQQNIYLQLAFIVLSVLFVGLVWEVYEFGVQGIMQVTGIASIPDSISDLVFDTLGGMGAFFVAMHKTKKLKNHE